MREYFLNHCALFAGTADPRAAYNKASDEYQSAWAIANRDEAKKPGTRSAAWKKEEVRLFRATTGYGDYCQRLSVAHCTQIAAYCRMGFYARKKSKIWDSGRLELQ
jgi:hypothetical protein